MTLQKIYHQTLWSDAGRKKISTYVNSSIYVKSNEKT